jgi:UDP-N-acetylglucosamine transferase subunit ALG13
VTGRPILLAASPGGHLDLLRTVAPALTDRPSVWLTSPGPGAEGLARRGLRVRVVPLFGRHPGRFIVNAWRSLGVVARERPRLVVTSGASVVLPACLLARALGAPIIFIETMARIHDGSATGRFLTRFAARTIVQWPELTRVYPQARVCRPALWESIAPVADRPEGGTFVAVGTHGQPFDRLLKTVDDAVGSGLLPGPVVAQAGVSTYRPRHFRTCSWLQPDEITDGMKSSRYVICHAGAGIVATGLRAGHRPLLLARRVERGEHTDDHQLQISRKLGDLGIAVPLDDAITAEHLAAADKPLPVLDAQATLPSVQEVLHEELRRLERPAKGTR